MIAFALLACAPEAIDPLALSGPPLRNVLMVSIDTLRRDAVGRYGDGESDTPFLDGLLSSGVVLDDHRSCSNWTYGAVLCALSGRTGVEVGWVPESSGSLDAHLADAELLPDRLRAAGLWSGLYTTNPYIGDSSGLDARYDHAVQERDRVAEGAVDGGLALVDQALEHDRWFAHLHFVDPHTGYDPPEAYLEGLDALPPIEVDLTRGGTFTALNEDWGDYSDDDRALLLEHMKLRYAGEVRYLDAELERLFEGLAARGALDDALVVLWSDHGEQFAEHGALTHGQSLYRQEVDAVAAFIAPGLAPVAWSAPTTLADLTPTTMALLGLEIPADATGLPVGEAPDGRARYAIRSARTGVVQSAMVDDLELIYDWSNGSLRLYDRAADPEQTENLYTRGDADALRLWALLAPRVDAHARRSEHVPVWPPL